MSIVPVSSALGNPSLSVSIEKTLSKTGDTTKCSAPTTAQTQYKAIGFAAFRQIFGQIDFTGDGPPGGRGVSFGGSSIAASAAEVKALSRGRNLAASLTGGFVVSDRVMPLGDHATFSGFKVRDRQRVAAALRTLPSGASPERDRSPAQILRVSSDEFARADRTEQLRRRFGVEFGYDRIGPTRPTRRLRH